MSKWWTLVAACAATCMLLVDVTIVNVALPDIQRSLNAQFSDLEWVSDAYALTLASALLTAGSLADRFGRRLLFLIGLSIFTASSLACGLAPTSETLIASRAVQGIGAAIMFATSLALLATAYQGRDRGTAFGVWGAVAGIATGVGPFLGGVITTEIGWRGIFLVNIPVGIAAIAVTVAKVSESKAPSYGRLDWGGIVTLTAGLSSLIYGLIRASEISFGDSGVIGCFVVAAVFLILFVLVEARSDDAMFDLSLLRIPTFVGGAVTAFAMNGTLFAMFLYIVLYLQNNLGYDASETGIRLLLISIGGTIAAIAAGRLTARLGARWLIGPGLVLVGIGLFLMSGLDSGSDWDHLVVGFIIAGIGSGLVNPPLSSTAVGVVAPWRSGMASGVNQTFRQVGLAVGIALYGSLFVSGLRSHLSDALSGTPLRDTAGGLADSLRTAPVRAVIEAASPADRGQLATAIHSSYADTLNQLLTISGTVAIVGGIVAFALIRNKDLFVPQSGRPAPQSEASASPRENAGR